MNYRSGFLIITIALIGSFSMLFPDKGYSSGYGIKCDIEVNEHDPLKAKGIDKLRVEWDSYEQVFSERVLHDDERVGFKIYTSEIFQITHSNREDNLGIIFRTFFSKKEKYPLRILTFTTGCTLWNCSNEILYHRWILKPRTTLFVSKGTCNLW